ncbi:MAG TPA: NAD-dependent epimerase/dehydratase family protein [Phycisphaerae bacterium]|nr:NAD-dependent epimerase/dehydratase family protein [Phycisphaerae bacterium]
MKILILGGTGFTGSHIVRQLAAEGHQVWMYHRGETGFPGESAGGVGLPAGVKHIYAELSSLATYREVLRYLAFDVVIHMRAMSGMDARSAIDVFSGHTGRMVVASSQDVYAAFGGLLKKEQVAPSSAVIREDSPVRTSTYMYGGFYEKLDVERAFEEASAGMPVTILRMCATYGAGDPRQRFFAHVKRMEDGRRAILFEPAAGSFRWTHGYVENVARAYVLAATKAEAANRIYNVGEVKTPTQAERVHAIGRAAGWRGQVIVVPREEAPGHLLRDVDFRHDVVMDSTAIRRELGYEEIVSYEEGLKRTVEWQRTVCPVDADLRQFDYAGEDRVLEGLGMEVDGYGKQGRTTTT